MDKNLLLQVNYADMYRNIQTELRYYLKENGLRSLVLGVSGGIDSALAAALAKPVCDELKIPLIGASISIESNKIDEERRARKIMENFCPTYMERDFTTLFYELAFKFDRSLSSLRETEIQQKIRDGNMKARIRMIYLYNLAQYHNGMVLSTDNYTEYLLGFWTLHGDVGDYGMFQNLWKTEVYGLAQWIIDNALETQEQKDALQACIQATPTDGLGITNSDLDQLGCSSYEEVDVCLLNLLQGIPPAETSMEAFQSIKKRHENSAFKRTNPYNIDRFFLLKGCQAG